MGITFFYKTLFVILAYLFGAFPTAYVIYRLKKGADIRTEGSGNVGGTNVARTVGAGAGILTIIVDILKGFLPMMALYFIYPQNLVMASIVSVVVIAGHDFPVYIKFKGGKGIATSFGVIVGICAFPFSGQPAYFRIAPIFTILAAAAIFFFIFKIVSVSSIAAAVATPLSFYFFNYPAIIVLTTIVWSVLALITHRSNIKRLIRKEEKKIKGRGA
ncbi:MAG: glycerol-3-phosphate 1-O-acyltransferase PlsY [Actinomycetota bacterium]